MRRIMAEVAISAAKVERDFCMLSGVSCEWDIQLTIVGEPSQQTVGKADDGRLGGQAGISDTWDPAHKHPTMAMRVSSAIWRR
jgi:hypothetical protein